ncbi:MAG TPA: hypothetical protein VN462_11260, partial [Negativicutes bacterium]|nr:hypothetical protein [Negativicutes bacterium]
KPLTVLMILSDTKSLQPDLAAQQLKSIRKKVKEVIWLNPLPGNQWSKYPTVELFKRHSTMWECSSLAHLANALRKQLG